MDLKELLSTIKEYTYGTQEWLIELNDIARYLNDEGVVGDFVECGSYKGGSSALLGNVMGDRHLWIYDSFQGLPQPTNKDGEKAQSYKGKCFAQRNDVEYILRKVGIEENRYTIRAGWFIDTFQQLLPYKVALLYCDADWYDSTMLILDKFYDKVAMGGCIILDDFGTWEGCREAFYDFCFKHNIKPLLERCTHTQAYWFKGKEHNRF